MHLVRLALMAACVLSGSPAFADACTTQMIELDSQSPPNDAVLMGRLGPATLFLPDHSLKTVAHVNDMLIMKYKNGDVLTHRELSRTTIETLFENDTSKTEKARTLLQARSDIPASKLSCEVKIYWRELEDTTLYLRLQKNTAGYRTMLIVKSGNIDYLDFNFSKKAVTAIIKSAKLSQ